MRSLQRMNSSQLRLFRSMLLSSSAAPIVCQLSALRVSRSSRSTWWRNIWRRKCLPNRRLTSRNAPSSSTETFTIRRAHTRMRSPIKCASARTYRSRPRELTSTSTPWRPGTTRWYPAMAVVFLWRERTPKSITKLVAILSPKVTFSCQLFRVRSRRPRPNRKIKSYRASYMRQRKKKTTLRATSNPTTSCPISQTFEPIRLWERKGLRPSQGFI